MSEKEDLQVGGYFFGSYNDASRAEKELKKIQYLEQRINSMNAVQLQAVYNKMLDEKVFQTPVGWEYLKYLKDRMKVEGVPDSEIRPIPLFVTFTVSNDDSEYSHIAKMHIKPAKSELVKTKLSLKRSVMLNIAFVIIIIAMFIITMKSTTPNIMNYKTAILNSYSQWEEDLNEREKALAEREAQIENSDSR